ncbi:hypothetical protein C9374_006729 [Naegleria lovaniensis]|uniref:F-box domain-containing protein n=1 Tax=Naegleria lovaniensis TaxID=51637 RepID=A0AA88GHM9_NAELO|nr:uncharacterized protein C9374_006729 [Naegleria lovaniensis]KAG2379612.1 hypothetical protein C9374_006729 [Naegleria lovaniensis]
MGVKLSHQQNAALLYPNLSARVNQNTTPNDPLEPVKKPTKIVLLGTGEGGKSTTFKALKYWYPPKRKFIVSNNNNNSNNNPMNTSIGSSSTPSSTSPVSSFNTNNFNATNSSTTTTMTNLATATGTSTATMTTTTTNNLSSSSNGGNSNTSSPLTSVAGGGMMASSLPSSNSHLSHLNGSMASLSSPSMTSTMISVTPHQQQFLAPQQQQMQSSMGYPTLVSSSYSGSSSHMASSSFGLFSSSASFDRGGSSSNLPPKSPRAANFSFDHSFHLLGANGSTQASSSSSSDLSSGFNNCIIYEESLKDSIDLREDFTTSFKSPEVRREYVSVIHRNVILAMFSLVDGSINHFRNIPYDQLDTVSDYYLIDCLDTIMDSVSTMTPDWHLTKQVAEKIKYLWNEVPQIVETYNRGHELCFEHMESARHWFTSLDRITDPNYVPTMSDILRVRVRTTGIVETMLHFPIKIKKTTSYYYYNCENEKVRLDVERSSHSSDMLHANQSFDGSMSIDAYSSFKEMEKKKKDYVVSYTIQDRFQDTKFTLDLDDILPQNMEPIIENKLVKDSEEGSKTYIMHKPIKVVLMGSQRSERRKWIHSFDDVSAVFFVVALSEFNQVLYEDRRSNRMLESLLVFNEIVNSTYFADVPVFLIFNKYDVFLEKLQKYDLSIAFGKEVPDDLKLNANNPFYQFASNFIQERLSNHKKQLEAETEDLPFDKFIETSTEVRRNKRSLSYEIRNGNDDVVDTDDFVLSQKEEKNIFDDLISKEERKLLKKALQQQNKKKPSLFGFLTPRSRREIDESNIHHIQQASNSRQNVISPQKRKKKKDEAPRTLSILDQAIEEESKASCSSLSTMNRNAKRLSDDNLLRQIMSQTYSNVHVRGMQQLTSNNIGADCDDDTENDVLDDDAEWTYCEEVDIHKIPDLPKDALIYVCMFLEARELCALSEVNYEFYKIATSDLVWRSLCLRYQSDIDENIVISKYALYIQQENRAQQVLDKINYSDWKLSNTRTAGDDQSQITTNDITRSNRRIFLKGVYKYWFEFGQSFIKRNIDFIVNKFMEQTNRKDIRVHITTAIDLDSLKPIMDNTFYRIIKHVADQHKD